MDERKLTAAVTQAVQEMVNESGEARSSDLVERARPKTSPIHAAFTWDDKKAAEEMRLIEARTWIRRVKIVYEQTESRLVHVPAVKTGEGVYKPASVIVQSVGEFERALDEAMQRLHSARRAVDDLRRVAEQQQPEHDRAAMISQIARGLEILESALQTH